MRMLRASMCEMNRSDMALCLCSNRIILAFAMRRIELGVTAEVHLVAGDPAVAICKVAEEQHADMIVMGSRGHGPLAAALLGSVTAHVVQHAHCPLMVVPDPQRAARHAA